jgi:putative selenate reductase
MSDVMKALPFEYLIDDCLQDYYTKGKILEVDKKDFFVNVSDNLKMSFNNEYLRYPVGPAAGPHTQLAQNLLAAYLTGARFFELKTVQIIDGKEMQSMIEKPCIDVKNVGYNVEWSTELTVEEAANEYIKGSVLLQVMAVELGLSDIKDFVFNISVGYNLEGIQSRKISDFIDSLKEAKDTDIFKECIKTLKDNINKFKRFKLEDIDKISSKITNTVTLSTMHGAKAEEILDIARHLITNKNINTFIKCNPTLLGYENVRGILDNLGYNDIVIRKEDFDHDLKFDMAVDIVNELKRLGKENGVFVGIKLTNTLPVYNSRKILPGESMYLSGKPLYPIAMGVSRMFAEALDGDIHISLSGGIDKNNVVDVLKTGIAPLTVSTLLLKPGGYKNLKSILDKITAEHMEFHKLDVKAVKELSENAVKDTNYKNKGDGRYLEDTLPTYDCFKVNCGICVDVCPNRANMRVYDDRFDSAYQIVHIENRCNECDNCHTFCTRGGFPYLKKVTLFADKEEFENSENTGILKLGEKKFQLRDEDKNEYVYDVNKSSEDKKSIEKILETMIREYPYLIQQEEK